MKLFVPLVAAAVAATLLPPSLASPVLHAKRFRKKSDEEKYKGYWHNVAKGELNRALGLNHNNNVAKNVILFLGDGMSLPTLAAARIYQGQQEGTGGEEGSLFLETFPYVGLSKTYNLNKQVPDSASTATAFLSGVKTNHKMIGVDGRVVYEDCTTMKEENKVHSVLKWAQDVGKRTGVVTSTRITHATPAAAYAHVPSRNWECDEDVPRECREVVKDIARQLVEDEPGASINVVMGGGNQNLNANAVGTPDDELDDSGCHREDNMNLTDLWISNKAQAGVSYSFVTSESEMNAVDTSATEFLMGIFSNDHMPYEQEKRDNDLDVPTLAEMTEVALKVLNKGPKGYFLLVEGGRIDHAHHGNRARRALDETVAIDKAIERAVSMTDEKDTLIMVTADHSHGMSFSGYPVRGKEIIGLAGLDDTDLAFTTLMYATGPGYNYTVMDNQVSRPNVTSEQARDWGYKQLAAISMDSANHAGEEVAIYALGPMAHLVHGLHEQNYIAHVMAYSACLGEYKEGCRGGAGERRGAQTLALLALIALAAPRWLLT